MKEAFAWSKNHSRRDLSQKFCVFLFWNTNSQTYPLKLVIPLSTCLHGNLPSCVDCFQVKVRLTSANAIEKKYGLYTLHPQKYKKGNTAATFFRIEKYSASYFTARRLLSLF